MNGARSGQSPSSIAFHRSEALEVHLKSARVLAGQVRYFNRRRKSSLGLV